MNTNYQLGITRSFPCNYLPEQNERLLVATDERLQNSDSYSWLMAQGFRRSGDQMYRPHCEICQACQSVRVVVNEFSASTSQRRVLKKNRQYEIRINTHIEKSYYALYENYINSIHQDGTMYPANYEQFKSFLSNNIAEQIFIEVWHGEKLISVAITDILIDALSAVYTFYHPEYKNQSLGVFSILSQIEYAKTFGKRYLYLGYQIDDCQKMNYKTRYFPYQILTTNQWKTVNK